MANKNLEGFTTILGKVATPQFLKAAKGQKRNNARAFTFTVSDVDRAKRFLILGSDGSFYRTGEEMSRDNAEVIITMAKCDESRALTDLIVEISTQGRAPKQDPALFALAIAASHGSDEDRAYALSKLPEVARTGTALFSFLTYAQQFRGWGRAMTRAVAAWYTDKPLGDVTYQTVKYRQRDGWTHRDVFRKAHPKSSEPAFQGLGEWILRDDATNAPALVKGYALAQDAGIKELPAIIRTYGLTWEMIPTEALNEPKVWSALLEDNVPLGALIRQLPRLTRIGVIKPFRGETKEIARRLTDPGEIKRSRIHPLNVLVALHTYASGRGVRGSGAWKPNSTIIDALDTAFYAAFANVQPAGKRTLISMDVSGSMSMGQVAGVPLAPREAATGLALVLAATEPYTHIIGFTGAVSGATHPGARRAMPAGRGTYGRAVSQLTITPSMRLDKAIAEVSDLPFGATDCALPMLYALEEGLDVDTFIVITDNETWAGSIHPHEALQQYRKKTKIDAKLIVLATTATKFSIADPSDPGMLDIAGFDSAVPQLVTEFSRGL